MIRFPLEPTRGVRAAPSANGDVPRFGEAWEVGPTDLLLAPQPGSALPIDTGADLRITLGGEVPDIRNLQVELPDGTPLGDIDVRYGCTFQPFALSLSPRTAHTVASHGARLRPSDPDKPVRVLRPVNPLTGLAPGLGPHLLLRGGTPPDLTRFDASLASLHTLQPFNWLEGCVLDGLRAAGHHEALSAHLDYYFPEGRLRYVGPRGEARANEIFGIEALLPFAFLPAHHPGTALMAPFVRARLGPDGLLLDRHEDAEGRPRAHTEITIEGCYTLAYPLAVACLRDGLPAWRELAWKQVSARCDHLVHGGVVAQRAALGGPISQADWARACGWFLLGVARTADVLRDPPPLIAATFAQVAQRALGLQRDDGLWSVYLSEPATGSDTSGSAAIAAGLALGARLGLLPSAPAALPAATRAVKAIANHLAPDGMLGGSAQLNRGGEPLQRGGFRVLAPFAMGLLASARAAVHSPA